MNLKFGDGVLIQGGTHVRQLLEDIAFECYRVGALPFITSQSDDYRCRVMKSIPAKTLEQVPRHLVGMVEKLDCMIAIEPYDDPSVRNTFPRDKLEARVRSDVPIRRILYGEETGVGRKWCYAGWPTRKAARYFGIDYPLYERFVVGGMSVSPKELMTRCETIGRMLEGAETLHVTDPEGTDFWVRIEGRRRNLDDGFVSDEDVAANDMGNNLPAGEVFIAPHETWGEGTIFCPITVDRFSEKKIRDAVLTFKEGRLDLAAAKSATNRYALVKSFRQALKVDQQTQTEVRTLNIAEIGIGVNPRINRAIGYILTDEKIIGSVHLALGSNFSYGGTSKSAMHWDFVTVPKVTMVARKEDGSETTIMSRGKLRRIP